MKDQEPITIEGAIKRTPQQFEEELRKKGIAGSTYDLLSELLERRGEMAFDSMSPLLVSRKFPDQDIPFTDSDRKNSYKIRIFAVMGRQIISPFSFEIRYKKKGEKGPNHLLFLVKRQEIKNSGRRKIEDMNDLKLARKIVRKIVKSANRVFPIPPVNHDS